jgi:MFS family permease
VSGYALTFGLALVPAGRLGDRLGYKQMFLTGVTVFTLASAACGISRSPVELIVSRLVQGLGAGIAVIGTALFGSGSGHSGNARLMPSLAHMAQSATVLNLAFVLAAWCARSACRRRWPPNGPRRTPDGFRPTRPALLV